MPADPYASLGLTKSATAAEIKAAYRKLARAHHPDLHPDDKGAEARFKALSAAYDLLKDPATRARFDAGEIDADGTEQAPRQYYRDYAEAPGGNPYQSQQGFRSPFGAEADPADIFAEMLRQRGARGGARGGASGQSYSDQGFAAQGQDQRFTLEVSFLDAARGADLRLTLGAGGDISVKIPPGAQDGQTLRLRGKGSPGFGGGPAGDALITLSLRPHPVFRREGNDILITLPITFDEAVLGAKVTAPTIAGPVSLTIPPGSTSGSQLRLRGRGVVGADGKTKGDQKVELRITAPSQPDAALREFLTEWRKTQTHDPRAAQLAEAET
jgi:DnaJ-class molecular chaperone